MLVVSTLASQVILAFCSHEHHIYFLRAQLGVFFYNWYLVVILSAFCLVKMLRHLTFYFVKSPTVFLITTLAFLIQHVSSIISKVIWHINMISKQYTYVCTSKHRWYFFWYLALCMYSFVGYLAHNWSLLKSGWFKEGW